MDEMGRPAQVPGIILGAKEENKLIKMEEI